MPGGDILVFASSAGGTKGLLEIFSSLPKLKVPMLVTQHLPATLLGRFAYQLHCAGPNTLSIPHQPLPLLEGHAYLAPHNAHLIISNTPSKYVTIIPPTSPDELCPSMDKMTTSAAQAFKNRTWAVFLSGLCIDGLNGARAIHHHQGTIHLIEESQTTSWSMPRKIAQENLAPPPITTKQLINTLIRANMTEAT